MSAVIPVGDFIIDCDPRKDEERDLWYVNGGIKTRNGNMILHFTAWGKDGQIATERAEWYCRIMTMFSTKKVDVNKAIRDILNSEEGD